ncbi:general substrate transporter [Hypoxylon rubiginosum]|uniref:General substrate transporter n=1 Tax=Hypoxylon rubiginosum TaxID=110542 RepID=A0ACB9YJS8_9PEZI|nr:general substrate transporter [Hypoxylon rubiginosum]
MSGPNLRIFLAMVATMASIANFSYDAAMINSLNVMEPFATYFNLNSTTSSLTVAIIYAGSVLALPLAGPILDNFGRRKGMIIATVVGLIGCILQVAAQEIIQLLVGRFLLGSSFIVVGSGGPSWLMELAPPKTRALITHGMLGSLPITGTIGAILYLGIWESTSDWAWRGGLMGELVGPVIALCLLPFCPESIRYLIATNREEEAFETLLSLRSGDRDDPEVIAEFESIVSSLRHDSDGTSRSSWKPLISPGPNLRRFSIAVLTNIFWQTNGTNFMPYFVTIVIHEAGVTDTSTLLKINVGISVWAALANVCGIYLTAQWGRRKMFLLCTPILGLCFLILGILQYYVDTYQYTSYGVGAIAICFLFQWTSFSSWMILNFSYPSEILKYNQRAKGMVASQAIGYLFGCMMTYAMPLALERISWRFYIINAAWIAPMVAIIWYEIDDIFEKPETDSLREVLDGVEVTTVTKISDDPK